MRSGVTWGAAALPISHRGRWDRELIIAAICGLSDIQCLAICMDVRRSPARTTQSGRPFSCRDPRDDYRGT
ncbi:MAG: hypothetical protein ACHQQQ_11490 [Bacteroidota bacterium]